MVTSELFKPNGEDQFWKILKDWFLESGGEISDAYGLHHFPNTGRGVVAKRDIEKGERLVQVPKTLQITAPWILKHCPEIKEMMKNAEMSETLDTWDLLTLFLLIERQHGKDSRWKLFLDSIPFKFDMPNAWPESCHQLLPSQTRKELNESLADGRKRFQKLVKINSNIHNGFRLTSTSLKWEVFNWTQCAIVSRNLECDFVSVKTASTKVLFPKALVTKEIKKTFVLYDEKGMSIETKVAPSWMKIGTDNDTSGICPVFEMFNHASDGENNAFFEFDRINKKLFVGTNKPIRRGEQVFINYSDREDDEMLLHYGFAFPPGMNKLSFIKCTIKDVTEAIHFLYQTPQVTLNKRMGACKSMKVKTSEFAISHGKINFPLREAVLLGLGDGLPTRMKTRNVMRKIELLTAQNQMIWKCTKREKEERRRALDFQLQFYQVVRRIVLVKIAEIDQLDFLSDKMSRVASPSEELPISLADNLRQVHRYIAEEWAERLLDEMDNVEQVLEMEEDYENDSIYSKMPVLHNVSMSRLDQIANTATQTDYFHHSTTSLRATFGSLADLRKYHDAHNPVKKPGFNFNLFRRNTPQC